MADYGVLPVGFARKPLATILAEIEEANRGTFGVGVIQAPQSPLGQVNGLMTDLIAQLWEVSEDTYQSYDPDQAEGVRLDMLAKLRLLARATDEPDDELRQAITNAGRARIDLQDLLRAVRGIDGVTYAQVFVNDTDSTDANGLSAHSVGVAVIGGDDAEVAAAVRAYVVPGIGTSGNVRIDVNIDGVCRSIWLVRPTAVPITLEVEVIRRSDRLGCPPAALTAIAEGLVADLSGDRQLINGEDVTLHTIRAAIEARYPNVEVVDVQGARDSGAPDDLPIPIAFDEIATFALVDITVTNAP
ncbi:hypothetical protein ABLE91_05855 [Aquabacter sp. CN5-332]|uniref:hypothetical protein n=1 Tax=Aquabacter sp. CN5-332 TaxID=3156608 RepID=UPI0032B51CF5